MLMKILVTGAFGNVGVSTLEVLLNNDKYDITCFDKRTIETNRAARKFKNRVRIIWGDLRNKKKVVKAVKGQEMVLHIGAVIPPKANKNNKYTEQVNFGGTKNIVDTMEQQQQKGRIIYTSSVAVYGDVRHLDDYIIYPDYPFNPSPGDFYAVTKIKAEEYVRNSSLEWVVFRLSYIPNANKMKLTPLMFQMPLDTPIEMTHTKDCGLAIANAINVKEVWGRIFNLGGGKKCQTSYSEFMDKMLPLMGIDPLPKEAFSTEPFHCCFYDTEELQDLLQFQNHTMDDLYDDMVEGAKSKRALAKMFKPIVKPFLLSLSPYYKKYKKSKRRK
ncbi:MAG: NAD(P)-dependent oxidoreductase [Asgard group archaeon]|nr:NAD(P)-dependent oxidoreductase [Asgard group archaeon]